MTESERFTTTNVAEADPGDIKEDYKLFRERYPWVDEEFCEMCAKELGLT